MSTVTVKRNLDKATRKTAPKKTSPKKRPNKKFIEQMAAFRGFMTSNDKTALATLKVKNVMQRVNNKTMSDDVDSQLNSKQCTEIQSLISKFVKDIDAVLISE